MTEPTPATPADATQATPAPTNISIQHDFGALRAEIDSLQQHVLTTSKPWYQETSNIIAAVALLFSFFTAGTAYWRENEVELIASRQELREILQRLAILNRDNVENMAKWKGDPNVMMSIGGFITQENSFLVRQAHELTKSLPPDVVTPSEYYAVAQSLFNAYDNKAAVELLELSIKKSDDFNVEVSALRMLGNVNFVQGKLDEGRKRFQQALDIFSKYEGYDPTTQTIAHVQTELVWAGTEAFRNEYKPSFEHLGRADAMIAKLGAHPLAESFRQQATQLRATLMVASLTGG